MDLQFDYLRPLFAYGLPHRLTYRVTFRPSASLAQCDAMH